MWLVWIRMKTSLYQPTPELGKRAPDNCTPPGSRKSLMTWTTTTTITATTTTTKLQLLLLLSLLLLKFTA